MDWSSNLLMIGPTMLTVDPPTWSELGVYAAAVLTLVGVIYTATATRRTGREANAVDQVPLLWGRIDALEAKDRTKGQRIEELQEAQRKTEARLEETRGMFSIAVDFIGELYTWGRKGGGHPEPTPRPQLREWLGHIIHDKDPA